MTVGCALWCCAVWEIGQSVSPSKEQFCKLLLRTNILVVFCDAAVGEISTESGLQGVFLCCLLPAIPTACSWQASVTTVLLGPWDLDAPLWREAELPGPSWGPECDNALGSWPPDPPHSPAQPCPPSPVLTKAGAFLGASFPPSRGKGSLAELL